MGEVCTEVKTARDVKWRNGKHNFITLSQVPSGDWTLYTNGASIKPQDLRDIADELDRAQQEIPTA